MSETHDVVDVILDQARRRRARRRPDRLGRRRLHPRGGRRRADGVAGDGDPAQRHGPPRDLPLDRGDDRQRRADGLLGAVPTDRRQALHRRSRRQDHAAARAAGRRLRSRPCRSCPGRGLGHTGGTLDKLESIPGWRAAEQRRDDRPARGRRRGDVRCRVGAGARGQEAVRAARRHRHGRGDPADRELDHEQEDRRGHRCAGARRQGRVRRVHEGPRRRPRAGRDDGRAGHRRRGAHGCAADRHGDPARPDGRQRARGARVGRGAGRRRPAGRGRADPGAGPGDAGRRRESTTSTRPTSWPTGRRWTCGGG